MSIPKRVRSDKRSVWHKGKFQVYLKDNELMFQDKKGLWHPLSFEPLLYQFKDGTEVISSGTCEEGETPVVPAENPSRETDFSENKQYTFKGWRPQVGPIYENQIYHANYLEEDVEYTDIASEFTSENFMDVHFAAAEWQKDEEMDFGPIQTELGAELDTETGDVRGVAGEVSTREGYPTLSSEQESQLREKLEALDEAYLYSISQFGDTMDYQDDDNDVMYSSSSKIIENAFGYDNHFYEIYAPGENDLCVGYKDGYEIQMSIETDGETGDPKLVYAIVDFEGNEVLEEDDTPYTACIRGLWPNFDLEVIRSINEKLYSVINGNCFQPYYCAPESANPEDWEIARLIREQIALGER